MTHPVSFGVCSNSCPQSRWCHPTISSSVVPFCSCFQSFPASGSFLVSWLFGSDGQSIGASVSASVLPMKIQSWFPLGLTGLISLQSKGLSRVFSNTTLGKHQLFSAQPFLKSLGVGNGEIPTPVFLPAEFHGQKGLVCYSPRGCKELDMTEHPDTHTSLFYKCFCLSFLWKVLSTLPLRTYQIAQNLLCLTGMSFVCRTCCSAFHKCAES